MEAIYQFELKQYATDSRRAKRALTIRRWDPHSRSRSFLDVIYLDTQNYRRKSSSFSVLRWAEMAALLTFGFSERVFSNA